MQWSQGTVFMKHIDKEGKGYIEMHPCWHMERFIASQTIEAKKAGGSVAVVTQDDYRKAHWNKSNHQGAK